MEVFKQKYWLIFPLWLCIVIYTNSLPGQFFWDDETAVLMTPEIHSFSDLVSMFTFSFWNDLYNDKLQSYRKGVYRPLIRITFALERKLWGDNPFGYRLTNVIIHAGNTGLVTVLAQAIFKSNPTAMIAGLLFTAHPVNVESISYIKNRSCLIGTFFLLLCLLMWIREQYFVCSIFFLISLITKESNFSIPILITFYGLLFYKKHKWKQTFNYIFFQIMCMILFLLLTFSMLKPLQIAETYDLEMIVSNVNVGLRMTSTLCEYILLLFFPVNLSVDRALPLLESLYSLKAVFLYCSLIVLLCIIFRLQTYKKYLFVIGFIGISLGPVLNIIPLDSRPVAEQRLYVPCIGWAMLMGGFFYELISKIISMKQLNDNFKILLIYTIYLTPFLILCFFSISVIQRNSLYKDVLFLWQDAANKNPQIARIHYNMGIIYFNRQTYNKAYTSFHKCLSLNEKYPNLNMQLGRIYKIKGDMASAIHRFKKEIELYKYNTKAEYMLAELYKDTNNFNEAYRHFYSITVKNPYHRDAYFQLAYIKYLNKEYDMAMQFYKKTIEIDPNYYESFNDIGLIYFKQNKYLIALTYFNKAIAINPKYYTAYFNAAYTYQLVNQHDKAIQYYQKTIDINYQYHAAYHNMAYVYSIHGQYETAIELYKKVLLFKPDYIEAYSGIADAYYAIKDYSNALKNYRKMIQLDPGNQHAHHRVKLLKK